MSLDPAMAALAARTAAAWRSEQDQDAQPQNPDECRCREHYLACSIHRPQRRGQDGRQLVTATTAHTLHAPESRSERARACPPVAGCPDLDPTWPGPDGNPRGPVRCTSFPACRCGEDEEDEDWPPTNTLRAMRLCPRCERPMVDHDDGACFEVTAETVTDDQIRSLRTEASDHAVTVVCKRALSVHELRQACEQACRDIAEAVPTGQRIEVLNTALLERGLALGRALIAREQCAAAINARAKGRAR